MTEAPLESKRITAEEAQTDPWILHDHPCFKEARKLSTFLLYAMARSTWALGYTERVVASAEDEFTCYAFGPDGSEIEWRFDAAGSNQEERQALNTLFRAARRKGALRKIDV